MLMLKFILPSISHSHVAADKLTGRFISGCQNQTRNFAGLHPKGHPDLTSPDNHSDTHDCRSPI